MEITEKIKKRLTELKDVLEPLKREYDREYKLWFDGKRTEARRAILKEYEDGAKGLKMFSVAERIRELESVLQA